MRRKTASIKGGKVDVDQWIENSERLMSLSMTTRYDAFIADHDLKGNPGRTNVCLLRCDDEIIFRMEVQEDGEGDPTNRSLLNWQGIFSQYVSLYMVDVLKLWAGLLVAEPYWKFQVLTGTVFPAEKFVSRMTRLATITLKDRLGIRGRGNPGKLTKKDRASLLAEYKTLYAQTSSIKVFHDKAFEEYLRSSNRANREGWRKKWSAVCRELYPDIPGALLDRFSDPARPSVADSLQGYLADLYKCGPKYVEKLLSKARKEDRLKNLPTEIGQNSVG